MVIWTHFVQLRPEEFLAFRVFIDFAFNWKRQCRLHSFGDGFYRLWSTR